MLTTPATTPIPGDLPRDADGHLDTSAAFGEFLLVEVTYNTDPEGNWVDDDDYSNRTLHGPFNTEAEADEWLQNHRPDDTEVKDMTVLLLNAVR